MFCPHIKIRWVQALYPQTQNHCSGIYHIISRRVLLILFLCLYVRIFRFYLIQALQFLIDHRHPRTGEVFQAQHFFLSIEYAFLIQSLQLIYLQLEVYHLIVLLEITYQNFQSFIINKNKNMNMNQDFTYETIEQIPPKLKKQFKQQMQIDKDKIMKVFNNIDQNQLIEIVKKNNQNRSHQEKQQLKNAFTKNPFLRKIKKQIGADTYISLLDEFVYKEFEPYQTIFQVGDIGQNFYILLDGYVTLYLPESWTIASLQMFPKFQSFEINKQLMGLSNSKKIFQLKILQQALLTNDKSYEFSLSQKQKIEEHKSQIAKQSQIFTLDLKFIGNIAQKQINSLVEGYKQECQKFNYIRLKLPKDEIDPDYKLVKLFTENQSLGEDCMINEAYRFTTAVTYTQCKFAVMNKNALRAIIKQDLLNSDQKKEQIIQKMNIFQNIDPLDFNLSLILPFMKRRIYKQGDYIYKEGDEAKKIYIIEQGKVHLMKECESQKDSLLLTSKSAESYFGEVEIFHQIPRYSSAISQSNNLILYRLDYSKLHKNIEPILAYFEISAKILADWKARSVIEPEYVCKNEEEQIKLHEKDAVDTVKDKFISELKKYVEVGDKIPNDLQAKYMYFNIIKGYQNKLFDINKQVRYAKNQSDTIRGSSGTNAALKKIDEYFEKDMSAIINQDSIIHPNKSFILQETQKQINDQKIKALSCKIFSKNRIQMDNFKQFDKVQEKILRQNELRKQAGDRKLRKKIDTNYLVVDTSQIKSKEMLKYVNEIRDKVLFYRKLKIENVIENSKEFNKYIVQNKRKSQSDHHFKQKPQEEERYVQIGSFIPPCYRNMQKNKEKRVEMQRNISLPKILFN